MNGDTKPCLADRIALEIMDTIERERRVNKDDLILAVERIMFADKREMEKANPLIVACDPATKGGVVSAWWVITPSEAAKTGWSDAKTYAVSTSYNPSVTLSDVVGEFNTVTSDDHAAQSASRCHCCLQVCAPTALATIDGSKICSGCEPSMRAHQQLAKAASNAGSAYPRTEADRVALDVKTSEQFAIKYGRRLAKD